MARRARNEDLTRAFGDRVRALRTSLRISQEQLAEDSDLDRSYVGKIERGEVTPTLDTLIRLAGGLGAELPGLVDLAGKPESAAARMRPPALLRAVSAEQDRIHQAVLRNADPDIGYIAAHATLTHPDTLTELADHQDPATRAGVAAHPAVTADTLHDLADDSDPAVRQTVAAALSARADTIDKLRNDPLPAVRRIAASRPGTTLAQLTEHAQDPDETVRAAAASHHNASPELLEQLGIDDDPLVRRHTASNPNTPPNAVELLAADTDEHARRAVQQRDDVSELGRVLGALAD